MSGPAHHPSRYNSETHLLRLRLEVASVAAVGDCGYHRFVFSFRLNLRPRNWERRRHDVRRDRRPMLLNTSRGPGVCLRNGSGGDPRGLNLQS